MVSHLMFYQLGLIILVWVFLMLYGLWPSEPMATRLPTPEPLMPLRPRSKEPKPFMGLTHTPHCAAWEPGVKSHREPPCAPPPPLVSTRGRRSHVDTSHHGCPAPACREGGWLGRGNIRANGHPSGGPWRQRYWSRCRCPGSLLETQGTLCHGKRVVPEQWVWAVGALAEGLGLRAVARVCEVAPNTGLHWLVERGGRPCGGLLAVLLARPAGHPGAPRRTLCPPPCGQGGGGQRGR